MIIKMPKQIRRSKQEIAEELRMLCALFDRIPPTTVFSQDNLEAMRAEMCVLSEGLTRGQVIDRYEDVDDYTMSAALNALEWLRDDGTAPSEGWIEMIAA